MRANWFIGIPVSPLGWFDRLPPPPSSCRLFGPNDLHLTVAFLGTVDEASARRAWDALSWTTAHHAVTFARVAPMGSPRRYSALAVLLDEGGDAVEKEMTLARPAAWRAAGVTPDDRPAKAHVTIARPKRRASEAERSEALRWASEIVLPAVRLELGSVALYTWAADRTSTLFQIVELAPLPKKEAQVDDGNLS